MHQKKTELHVIGALRVMEHAAEIFDREAGVLKKHKAFQHWNLICAGNSFRDILFSETAVRKKYKWKYIGFILKDLKKYNIKLLIKAIVKL
jgi:hypothetical protein